MPEDLLLELETAAPVAESLEKIEDMLHELLRVLNGSVECQKGTALTFENAWQRIVTNVAKGQTAEMQAVRQRLLNAFEKRLDLLKRTHALFTRLHKWDRTDLPNADVFLPEIADMERFKARVFDRWQTADDLEDLAARDYPLSTTDLDQIGAPRRPPASWYAEEGKPF